MSEKRLNQIFLLHVHKELTESLNVVEIASYTRVAFSIIFTTRVNSYIGTSIVVLIITILDEKKKMNHLVLVLLTLLAIGQRAVSTAPNLGGDHEDRSVRQVAIPTAVPSSCTAKLSDFSYPSSCPSYTLGQSFSSFLLSFCTTFCQSECIDPFLKYMEACNLDTTNLKRYCGSSSGQYCCKLLTTASDILTEPVFYATCNFIGCLVPAITSQCGTTYKSYGCCLANLNNALGINYNDWGSCGLSAPSECLYEPWPLSIPKETLIAIVAGGGGSLILLCAVMCSFLFFCCSRCGTSKRRVVTMTSTGTKMKPFA